MSQESIDTPLPADFQLVVENVKKRIGKQMLSDEELLVLCAQELSRTYTHDEKKYI